MELINKIFKNDQIKLLKCDQIKKNIKEHQIYLNRYKINKKEKTENDYFYCEALIQTLKNKEIFEGAFVKSYDDMHDYWQTLNYEERKKLINVDIEKAIKNQPYVTKNNRKYYLPLMNDKINAIYEQEMVLFELKQYNRLRFDCKDMIEYKQLSLDLILSKFTSLIYIQGQEDDFYAYCEINKTLYRFINHQIKSSFTFVNISDMTYLNEFIRYYEANDEMGCLEFLIEKKMISDKMIKKVKKKLERRKQ